jgi:hypothetical protein
VRRQNQSREKVLARLWDIANLDPEMTRNSASAQIKALAMIVAIEGLIPSRTTNDRRAVSAQNKSAPPTAVPQIDADAWLREQQGKTTGAQPNSDLVCDEDGPGVPDPTPGAAARPLSPAETTPSAPHVSVSASAPDTRLPSSIEKKPDTWRLRL